ncbi:SMI1/KNR4 family protein [Streptomyces bambusae]|uniref:SMI1/KNR4 family protein n=1 Tax=Streptomyces bambusae TaxID=1550616 RepID=A0ABS6Z4E3_9ACTN|nr:SMI1/KNR4 family protein [Streptomyces bambusae]MBW5482633.1 SMI1/KNR4 family protein [Streptomyces bambusae]
MTEHPDIAALAQVMVPTFGVDEALDWPSVEGQLDCRLPSDYKAFMSLYGGGGIDDLLNVFLPLHQDGIQWDPGAIEDEVSGARATWEHTPVRRRPDLDPAHILPWGQTSGPDLLCWLTTDPDPDRWPVLVWGRHTAECWTQFDCGMARFLLQIFTSDLAACPLSDASLWGSTSPKFVHWREQQIRWKAGRDPFTNEPDPYADMFPR